ncbi:MAG: GNAT family N-acetyltransferase [Vicinamibacteria bacterium]|nr:GNAT family N-acetyltransferase [Vicinamibacteria bacterium]
MNPETADRAVTVRRLRPQDLEAVIALDARSIGRRRDEYFKLKLKQALSDTGIEVSLAAEIDGVFAGFLLARVYYGEFGMMEPTAVLDTMGVSPELRGRHVGGALISQLGTNLLGLGIQHLQTEAPWENIDLIAFFHHEGFRPAERLCLDLDLAAARIRVERRDLETMEPQSTGGRG